MSDTALTSGFAPNSEQARAIAAEGHVFVSAGAGTGKTHVLVERFALAVLERGLAPDRVLAITYTDRAAAELRGRIRARLVESGRADLARELDGAWISTIHAFCARVLRRHALAAGLDPGFVQLDASPAEILRQEAYGEALERLAARDERVLDVVAAYGADRLRAMIDDTHERLRTAGSALTFSEPGGDQLAAARSEAIAAAEAVRALAGAGHYLQTSQARAAELAELALTADADDLCHLATLGPVGKLAALDPYDAAVRRLELAARDAIYARVHPVLNELLHELAAVYAGRKRAASAVDFDDLQLETRRLFRERPALAAELAEHFAEVLVDEFQDTNELQCELIDAVIAPSSRVFFVGDEFQSIYRFRNADLEVFRARHADARSAKDAVIVSLRTNYRSRAGVLAGVNHLFGRVFGTGFEPLLPGAAFPELESSEPVVEFIVTDAARAKAAGEHPRDAEARALAERVAALVKSGSCRPGDVVLLFAASTDADRYEAALRDAGLETLAATGRRYFAAQAVRDVLAYLRLVRNRYDDAAFLQVIASPLVGVSNDTLALLRMQAPKRPLFTAVEVAVPSTIAPGDARLLAAFRQRFDRLVDASARSSLAGLVERVVLEHDLDLALLAAPRDGARRYANVRKLAALAREYEALRGPDLEGFLTTVGVRQLAVDREAEAVIAEEGEDAVRLMTIHAAKGLQFPVVVVADTGRTSRRQTDDIIALPDGRVGVKVPDGAGVLRSTAAYEEAHAVATAADDAERERVSYVALTRAIDRLIVSGTIDGRAEQNGDTPMARLLQALGVSIDDGDVDVPVPGGEIAVRIAAAGPAPTVAEPPPIEVAGQLAFFLDPADVEPALAPVAIVVPPAPGALPEAPAIRPSRLSFTALGLFERCGYRFYAERILRLRPGPRPVRGPDPESGGALAGIDVGTAVHELLEHEILERDEIEARVRTTFPVATGVDVDRVADLVGAWRASPLAARLAALDVRRESAFLLAEAGAVLAGRLDVLATGPGEALVVDFKTNRLEGRAPEAIRDDGYALQEAVYALALLRQGAARVEIAFAFLDGGDAVASRRFDQTDVPGLAARVQLAVEAAQQGPYEPRPGEICGGCPALDVLCAGPGLDPQHGAADA